MRTMIRWPVFLWYLSWSACEDLRYRRIPNRLLAQFLAAEAALRLWDCLAAGGLRPLFWSCGGLLAGAGLLFFVRLLSGGGIGAGDVKLLGIVGFHVGGKLVVRAAAMSCVLAAGACTVLLLLKKLEPEDGIPLAPFLLAGTLAAVMAG